MTAQTVFCNQNIDDVGFIFSGVANAATTAMSSPFGNLTWTARTLSASKNWNGLTCGNGIVMAVASDGTTNLSIDGMTWSASIAISTGTAWSDLAFGNDTFIAINNSSNLSAFINLKTNSYSGWTTSNLPSSTTWNCINLEMGYLYPWLQIPHRVHIPQTMG